MIEVMRLESTPDYLVLTFLLVDHLAPSKVGRRHEELQTGSCLACSTSQRH
jgi:hypothetical protein